MIVLDAIITLLTVLGYEPGPGFSFCNLTYFFINPSCALAGVGCGNREKWPLCRLKEVSTMSFKLQLGPFVFTDWDGHFDLEWPPGHCGDFLNTFLYLFPRTKKMVTVTVNNSGAQGFGLSIFFLFLLEIKMLSVWFNSNLANGDALKIKWLNFDRARESSKTIWSIVPYVWPQLTTPKLRANSHSQWANQLILWLQGLPVQWLN